jgi:hypothetical protein
MSTERGRPGAEGGKTARRRVFVELRQGVSPETATGAFCRGRAGSIGRGLQNALWGAPRAGWAALPAVAPRRPDHLAAVWGWPI